MPCEVYNKNTESVSTTCPAETEVINYVCIRIETVLLLEVVCAHAQNDGKNWMDSDIRELIKGRDLYLYKFKKTGNKDFNKLYCSLRNKIQRKVKIAKTDYIQNKIEENRNNPKKLWSQLKELGYSNKSKYSPNSVLKVDNYYCFDPKMIAKNLMAFSTVAC